MKPFGYRKVLKKIMTHFANFPRPGENDPYMVLRLNISSGFQIISRIWLSILPMIVSRYFFHLILQLNIKMLLVCHQVTGEKYALVSRTLMARMEGLARVVEALACVQPQVEENLSTKNDILRCSCLTQLMIVRPATLEK